MRLLLDTHVWLWGLLEPERLSRRARGALEDAGNERWLSPISAWETLILAEKGRLRITGPPAAWVAAALTRSGTREAPLTHEIILALASIRLPHRDPADHFLAATARVFGLTLLTADARLLAARTVPTLAA